MASLDPGFGTAGVVKLPSQSTFAAYGTAIRSGSLLVSGGSSVQVLNDLGAAGNAFGGAGSLTLPVAANKEFQLGDFTVDPQGRLLVVGSSFFPQSENPSPLLENGTRAFRPGLVRILRFLPDGELDATFGREGVVETGLGLPSPRGTDQKRLGSHPAVAPTGIAVDPRGQIVVTGGAVVRLGESCVHDIFAPVAVSAGFVARFNENGAPDLSFGRNGLVGGRSLSENPLGAEAVAEPLLGPSGRITYLSGGAYACEPNRSHFGVAQLTEDGRTRSAFGRKGAIIGPYLALAGAQDGSVVALAEVPRGEKEDFRSRLIRIAPNGRRDGSFGKHGRAEVELGPGLGSTLDSLAVDPQGRILVGGTLGTGKGRSIVLLRVSARGRWETRFGPRGRVATRVRHLAQFGSSDVFFDQQGRLVTVHQYVEELKGRSGLVVARYLLQG